MVKRIVFVLILIPLAALLISLMVANRTSVPVSIDVFHPGNPALTFHAPMFVWMIGAFAVGILIGGISDWFSQGKYRKRERTYRREAEKLRYEVEETKRHPDRNTKASTSLALKR